MEFVKEAFSNDGRKGENTKKIHRKSYISHSGVDSKLRGLIFVEQNQYRSLYYQYNTKCDFPEPTRVCAFATKYNKCATSKYL